VSTTLQSINRLLVPLRAFGLSALLVAATSVDAADKKPKIDAAAPLAKEELAPMDEPLMKVDGAAITGREYMGFLQAHPEIIARASHSDEGKKAAFRELVAAFLLQKAMYTDGLLKKEDKNPSQQQVVEAFEKLAERHFPLPPSPDDAAGFAYYQAHQNEFGIPPMIRMNEILIKISPKADQATQNSARERAEKALNRVIKGEKFVTVAAEVTENPVGKVTGGDIGFVEPQKEPWMAEAIKNLKVGEKTGILKSPTGFVILEVSDIRAGITSPYANVRDKVIKMLRDTKQRELRDPYVKGLAQSSKIEVISPDLKALFPEGVFQD